MKSKMNKGKLSCGFTIVMLCLVGLKKPNFGFIVTGLFTDNELTKNESLKLRGNSTEGGGDGISTEGDGEIISTEGDGEIISTEGDGDGISTEGDGEIISTEGDGEIISTEGDGEIISTEGDGDGISTEGDGEIISTEGDGEIISTEGDREIISTEGDGGGISTEGDGGGVSTEGDGEIISTEGDGGGISTEGDGDGVSTEGDGEIISTEGDREIISTEGDGDGISSEGDGEIISTEGDGEIISTEGDGDGISTEGDGDGISTEGDGEIISTEGDGDGISTEGDGEIISTEGDGEIISTEGDGDGIFTEGDGDGISTEGDGEIISTEGDGEIISTEGDGEIISTEGDGGGISTKFILINTYMRSGSTFLGRILGYRSDAFYFFEPLHKLWTYSYTKGSKLCNCMKPYCEYRPDALNSSLQYLSDIFDCKLQKHSGKARMGLLKCCSGPKWSSLGECKARRMTDKECLAGIEKKCLPTNYRVIKVLRTSLEDAALMLHRHPNLVIVHLFRDPRGTFDSQFHTDWFPIKMGNFDAFVNDAKAHCERLTNDLVMGISLMTTFSDRVKLVQYEDLYGNVEKAKVLYKLIGMDVLEDSDQFLKSLMTSKINGTRQLTNLSGPFKYRTSLPFKYIRTIDEECKEALRMLGLKTYESEDDLLDINFNPVDGNLTFEL